MTLDSMSMAHKVLALMVALVAFGGGSWAGGVKAMAFLDSRYAPVEAVADVQWTTLKKEIRELRKAIAEANEAGNDELKASLEDDLEETIDRFCRSFPDDRECKRE